MELRNITTFLRVAELQNFTHAAQELGYSQSAVTVQIRQLEIELGVNSSRRQSTPAPSRQASFSAKS